MVRLAAEGEMAFFTGSTFYRHVLLCIKQPLVISLPGYFSPRIHTGGTHHEYMKLKTLVPGDQIHAGRVLLIFQSAF